MSDSFLIEVSPKPCVKDPLACGVAEDLKPLRDFSGVRKIASSKLYRFAGSASPDERVRIGRELLCDPVIEEFRIGEDEAASPMARRPVGRTGKAASAGSIAVDVWFKPGVTDTVGESVLKGLRDMGLENVQYARTGTRYRFWGLKNVATAEKLALALLINPLIHDRTIHAD